MATVKTAISVREDLFDEVNDMAKELNMSRSRLVALAIEAFIERHRNHRTLQAINKAYEHALDETEDRLLQSMTSRHAKLLDPDRW